MPTVTLAATPPRGASAIDIPTPSTAVSKLPADKKRAAKLQGFEGKPGQALVLAGNGSGPVEVLVGLGKPSEITIDRIRQAAAAYARAVSKHEHVACTLAAGIGGVEATAAIPAVTEGMRLATYRFTTYKADSPVKLKKITLIASGRGLRASLSTANAIVDAVTLARDLGNEPGGSLTPQVFATRAKRLATKTGIKVTVWDEARIRRERLGGLLAVNQGSENPPRFLTVRYVPTGRKPKANLALVGKGITFDSGGLSLKNPNGMVTMKVDMAGGAAVLAAMSALPAVDAPVAVTGFIPLSDNMTGGAAQRPGDVFTARNGKTVEVLNTDAEGRLILADALAVAAEGEPDAIIDIATLTGSASVALGAGIAALMSTDDKLATRLEQASGRSGEKLWRLPLPSEYRSQIDSTIADLKNIGSGPYGGTLVAGLFLKEFTDKRPWAHIDMGMAAFSDSDRGLVVKGGTGFGVRVLIDTLANW